MDWILRREGDASWKERREGRKSGRKRKEAPGNSVLAAAPELGSWRGDELGYNSVMTGTVTPPSSSQSRFSCRATTAVFSATDRTGAFGKAISSFNIDTRIPVTDKCHANYNILIDLLFARVFI